MNPPSPENHCTTCGKVLRPGALICDNCGASVASSTPAAAPYTPTVVLSQTETPKTAAPKAAAPHVASPKPKSRSLLLWIGIFVLVLCICVVAVAALYTAASESGMLANLLPGSAPTATSAPIIISTLVVPTVAVPTEALPTPFLPTAALPTAAVTTAAITTAAVPTPEISTAAVPAGTSQPGPTLVPATVDFTDDFSDPASGWKVVDSAEYTIQYIQPTGYQFLIKKPDYFVYSFRSKVYQNVIVAARGRLGSQKGSYLGLICRIKDANHYYAVSVSANLYNIGKQNGDQWVDLTKPTWLPFVAPLPDNGGFLDVTFSCIDNRLSLTVNDIAQPVITDGDIAEGSVGVLAGSGRDASQDGVYADVQYLEFSTSIPNP